MKIAQNIASGHLISYLCALLIVAVMGGCSKHKSKEKMSANELTEKAVSYSKKKKYDDAIVYLEELVARFPDHANLAQYRMLLAELYFKNKEYPAAQQLYEHYNQFYPSDQQAEYSKYKSLLSMFHQTLTTDCDQTPTETTVLLCDEYLQNSAYNAYRKDVINIQNVCENKLIDKETYVFNFYVKHEKYDAAHKRLAHLKSKYLSKNPGLEPRVLYLECKLAHKERKKGLVKERLDLLFKKYPTSQFTHMANAMTHPIPFMF